MTADGGAPSEHPVCGPHPSPIGVSQAARSTGSSTSATGSSAHALSLLVDRLRQIADAGSFVSSKDVELLCARAARHEADPRPITVVGIPTRGARPSLTRCIESLIRNCNLYSRTPDVAGFDDSPNSSDRDTTKDLLASISRRLNVNLSYAGIEEKLSFAADLGQLGGFDPELIEFALSDSFEFGHSTGANRNAFLLHSAGEMGLSLDDDVECKVASTPEREHAIALDSTGEVQDFAFFPNRQATLQSAQLADADILGTHQKLLGRSVPSSMSTVLDGHAGPSIRVDFGFLANLGSGSGRVLATQNGTIGDSGMSAPSWLWLRGESRSRLVSSEGHYRSACASREITRVAGHHTITTDPWCMATALGLDNRELLPPFFPVLRNQDGLFGIALRACFAHGYMGHLPFAVVHAPPEHRGIPDRWRRATSTDTWNIVLVCLTSFQQDEGLTDEARMRRLGSHLVQIGSLSQTDFENFVRLQLAAQHNAVIQQLEQLNREYGGSPEYWSKDIRAYVFRLRTLMRSRDYTTPRDVAAIVGNEMARGAVKNLVRMFGRLLRRWPDIVATAKELKAKGRTLARPIDY